ncbi:mandelate racemase/muconate lactonizing enzyme family protein [Natronolimnobius sp. AArcel1]|uniref:mandelate racemase/muconate lactonizing enzyme family protein n=1 Tax=Natronolimnobius sp. AArcel1 TaxID=1679093 RepID=UPI0013ECB96A|nr:mandelate racemase/muconate lactonizing enzyme family protein [Natronolimnobius sp. AArcel1]NGM67505.1 mandelate racemase/muconate lactonizing enzyme family protein [Natronolimnobius sp. AArcel1]
MEITILETFTSRRVGFVRVHTSDGDTGIGQLSPYNADIAATVFHRQIAPQALGRDPLEIESLVEEIITGQYKFPWSYVCRAACGLDTALWDLRGKRQEEPVVSLLGGEPTAVPVYGSSMRRDIEPEAEADRLVRLRDEDGYDAFKIRIGGSNSLGDDEDEWDGRSEQIVPTVRQAIGDDVDLYVDANGAYTPEKAIEIGQEVLEPNDVVHYEEPCPFWELEQTAVVTERLDIPVTGGEQDNDLAQWRRMLEMGAVDVAQPDVCYIGGLSRAKRVAELAADAGLPCVPHSANHSLVTVFALHLLGAIDNGGRLEFSIEDHWATGLYDPELTVEDGAVEIPSRPGWGVTLDPDWLATAQYEVSEP